MHRTVIDFHKRLERGDIPVVYINISTSIGERVYSTKSLLNTFEGIIATGLIADGSVDADGSEEAGGGGYGILEASPRITNISALERSLQPDKYGLPAMYTRKTLQNITVELANADLKFSKLIPQEAFISKALSMYVGFEDLQPSTFIEMFRGQIHEINLTRTKTVLRAYES